MLRCALPAILSMYWMLFIIGCSSGVKMHPVTGNVTVDGEAMAAGSVTLHPDGSRGNTSLDIAGGKVVDGHYEIFTGQRAGALPGHYIVLVTSTNFSGSEGPPMGGTAPMPRSLIHPKYSQVGSTPLSFEVVADPAAGAYDLAVSKK